MTKASPTPGTAALLADALPEGERLMSAAEVARLCSTTTRSVRSWIATRRLPSVLLSRRCRRVRASALAAWLAAQEGSAA